MLVRLGGIGDGSAVFSTGGKPNQILEIKISRSKYPEAAKHIEDAQNAGQPDILTKDNDLANVKVRRADAMKSSGLDPDSA